MTYPGHRPALLPVAGHGCCFLKLLVAALERLMCPCLSRTQDVQRRVVYMVLCPCGIKGRLQSIQKSKSAIFLIDSLSILVTRGDAQCFGYEHGYLRNANTESEDEVDALIKKYFGMER